MGAESTFFKQWMEAEQKTVPGQPKEKSMASFGHELSKAEVAEMIAGLPKLFVEVDNFFVQVLEAFTDEKAPIAIEHFAQEQQMMKGSLHDQLKKRGFTEPLVSAGLALMDIPAVILSQMMANRRKAERPDVQFHQLPEEDRQSVYLLSTWQQRIADYFIAFNEQDLTPAQASEVYNKFEERWLGYVNQDAMALLKRLQPDMQPHEFKAAANFEGHKRGIWGTVGVALELSRQGYRLRWSDPETDVLRKIDLFASSSNPEVKTQWAISVKGWKGLEDHVVMRAPEDVDAVPYDRQEALNREWSALQRGVAGYKRKEGITTPVEPLIMVVSTDRQDSQTGKMRFSQQREGVTA